MFQKKDRGGMVVAKQPQPHVTNLAEFWLAGSAALRRDELVKEIRGLKGKLRRLERELKGCDDSLREFRLRKGPAPVFQQMTLN